MFYDLFVSFLDFLTADVLSLEKVRTWNNN